MQYFLLQTAALMLAAYFLGALAACLIRRSFFPHTIAVRDTYAETGALQAPAVGGTTMVVAPTTAPPRPPPRIEPTPRPGVTAAEANRFERALTGEGKPAAAPVTGSTTTAPRPATVAPPSPAAQPPKPAPVAATPAPAAPTVATKPAPAIAPTPAPVPAAAKPAPTVAPAQPTAPAKPTGAPPVSVPPQAMWPAMRNQVVPPKPAAPTVAKPQPAPAAAPASPARPAPAAPAITPGQPVQAPAAAAAPVIGAASAAATAAAAAAAAATRVTAQPQVVMPVAGGSGGATTVSAPRPAASPAAPPPALPAAAPLASDVLTRIRAIDADLQQRLYGAGVRRYSDIAAWSPADVGRITSALGLDGRITRENWIEQAQVLAKGGVTDYARRLAEGAPLAEVPPPPLTPKAAPPAAASKPAAPASVPAAGPAASAAASTPAASAAAAASAASIAAASAAAAAARLGSAPHDVEPRPAKLADAIRDQAEKSAGDTARGARGDLAGLRSVRSEILRRPEAERAGAPDDLKRIRGIGVLIEKKLNSMGITGYDQVANWTSQDIDRISQVLDFKGRIERENWVEQARILASGGQTEFSRRVDRGEVESSRTQKT